MSRNDTDYLYIYNWQILEKLAKDPKNTKVINGHKVVTIDAAVKGGALFYFLKQNHHTVLMLLQMENILLLVENLILM